MAYEYKNNDRGIIAKLSAMGPEEALDAAVNYMTECALSPDAFRAFQRELLAAAKSSGNARTNGTITYKVARKGGVSVYGLQQMPVTLYAEQWERFLAPDSVKSLLDYIASNPSTEHPATPVKPASGKRPAIEAQPACTATIQRKGAVKLAA